MGSVKPEVAAPVRQSVESMLVATSRGVRRAYDRRLARLDVSLTEASLLAHVHQHGPLTQTQLAEALGIGRAATGALVDALERKGLVERLAKPGDRRVRLVSATKQAGRVLEEIAAADADLRRELWAGMPRTARRQLFQLLLRLQGNLAAILYGFI